jgi:hypothetical protein
LFHSYPPEKKKEVIDRLYKFQNGKCFLCEEPLDLSHSANIHLDHKIPRSEKGLDDESNWVLLCKTCNLKKGDKPVQLAKNLLSFERDKRVYGENFTLGKVLELLRGKDAKYLLMRKLAENKIELVFQDERGLHVEQQLPVYEDVGAIGFISVFTELPIDYLFHDSDLNPRAISEKNVNLIEEFYYKNPQLHVCLGRIEKVEELQNYMKVKVLIFDGQHKAVAHLYNGRRRLPIRLFTEYNYEKLKEVNFRAHTDLVQMEFFRSITAEVGSGMFADVFREYLNKHSRETTSEKAFLQSIELPRDRREMGKHFQHWLEYNILHPEKTDPYKQNKMSPFIEGEKTRERQKPISYDSFKKTFMRFFVYRDPSDDPIAPGGSEQPTSYLRFEERDNVIRLMNMMAEKALIGKFDLNKGAHKLEDRLSKGEKIPEDHVKAYRIFRPKTFGIWCEVLSGAIKTYLKIKGRLSEKNSAEGKIFWCKIIEEDWQQVESMIDRVFNHKLWETKDKTMIEVIGTTKKDIAQSFITEGKIGDKKVYEPPINTSYVFAM